MTFFASEAASEDREMAVFSETYEQASDGTSLALVESVPIMGGD